LLRGVTLPAVRHDLTSLPARDRGQQDDSHNDWTYETGAAHLGWAFGYNIAAIPIAAAGLLNPLIAAAAMSLSSVLVVYNSLRIQRVRSTETGSVR
ncbi:hypothetical protein MUG60_12190, partial [Kaistella montana]|nr:hypothetical protein [Kaistella montana]